MAPTASKTTWDDAHTDEVSAAILGAARALDHAAERALDEVGVGITAPQFRMLSVLAERGPSSVAALAADLHVNRSTALRMVERLVAADVVSRENNPANGREVVVKPTRTGSALIKKVATRRRRAVAKLFQGAGVDVDRKQLKTLAAVGVTD